MEHFVAVTVAAIVSTLLVVWVRRLARRPEGRRACRAICYGLALLLLASDISDQLFRIGAHTWSLQDSLPLHLCHLGLIVTAIALVGAARNGSAAWPINAPPASAGTHRTWPGWRQAFYELSYFWGLGGTVQALLTPDVPASFPSPLCVRFFVSHAGIVCAVLVMTVGLRRRPRPRAPLFAWSITVALAAVVLPLNLALGSNYMYLAQRPESASIMDYMGPWPWSLLTLVGVGAALILLCYAPFWVLDLRARRDLRARSARAGNASSI